MRSLIVVITLMLIMSFISSIVGHRIPGIIENPSLGKIKLCKAASGMHANFIQKYVNSGIIIKHQISGDGEYTFIVNKEKWDIELHESQEVAAIAGWCKVSTKNGKGKVFIYEDKDNRLIGTVVDGNYEV